MPYGNAFNYTAPILQQVNRAGDILMYGDQARRQNELQSEQMLTNQQQRKLNAFSLQEKELQSKLAEQHRNAFSAAAKVFDPIQSPREFLNAYTGFGGSPEMAMKIFEDIGKGMVKIGENEQLYDPRIGEVVAKGGGSGLTGDAKNLQAILGRPPTLEELERHKRAGAMTVNMPKISLERESSLVDQGIKDIKENRKNVVMSRASIDRIDRALDIIERQGDTVTGLSGQFRRVLAPFAKTIGMDVDKATDAQLLDSLLTEGAGGLRQQVVGPGPVSNYEQQIMQKVSGGKMSYAEGVRSVLEYQRELHSQAIEEHNEQIKSISGIKGYENIGGVFKPIPYKRREKREASKSGIKREGIYNGRKVVEYEDGRIEYAD